MGNDNYHNKKNDKIKLKNLEKERFDNSNMEIYICGKYSILMEVLIGESEDSYEVIDIKQNSNNYSDKIIIDIENNEERIKENYFKNDDEKNEKLLMNYNLNYSKNYNSENKEIDINQFLNNLKLHKNYIIYKNNYQILNKGFNKWNISFYCENGFDKNSIELIKQKIADNLDMNKNTFILFVESVNDIYLVIDIFSEINKEFHPLFLFIIKEKTSIIEIKEKINDYIKLKNIYMFNLRNVTILNEVDLEEKNVINEVKKNYILDVYSFLINSWFYYNNFGDDFVFKQYLGEDNLKLLLNGINEKKSNIKEKKKNLGLLNILLIGRPGVGKSTLVNLLCQEKRSMEGKGASVTKYITRYIIDKYNISLYDSPGFESNRDIKNIMTLIEDLNSHLIKSKNQIHMVFYLLNAQGTRDFYDKEKMILNILYKNKIPIFFLLTFSPSLEKGNEIKEVVEDDLQRIFYNINTRNSEDGLYYYERYVKIFPVHLLDEINGSCKNFGLKTLLNEVYNRFQGCIIQDYELNKLKQFLKDKDDYISSNIDKKCINELENTKKQEIFRILDNNILYKYIKEIDDIIISAKEQSAVTIYNYSIFGGVLGILGFLSSRAIKKFKKDILIQIAEYFNIVINEKEKEDLIEEHNETLNKDSYEINIPLYSTIGNYNNIQCFGNQFIEKFSRDLKEEGIEGLAKYLIDLIDCYNTSILGIKEISNNNEFNE